MLLRLCFIFQLLLSATKLMAQNDYINEYLKKDSIIYDTVVIIKKEPLIINKKVYLFEKEKPKNKFLSLEAGPGFPLKSSHHKGNTIVEPSGSFSVLASGGFFTKKFRFD